MMKHNYRKMSPRDLLTNLYSSISFRKDYDKWTMIGNFHQSKQQVNSVIVDYEHWVVSTYESHWFYGRWLRNKTYTELPVWVHTELINKYLMT